MITTTLINRDPIKKLACKEAKTACTGIALALELQDKASGKLAYYLYSLNQLFKQDKITEYKDIVSMCDTIFGIKRAQVFNLIRAGSFIVERELLNEDGTGTGKYIYSDKWTNFAMNENGTMKKPFSNTALVRIAEFIGNSENDISRARYAFVDESITKCNITSDMSVSKIMDYLTGENLPDNCTKQTKPKNDPPKNDPPKNDPPKNDPPKNDPPKNDKPKSETPETPTDEYKLTFNVNALRELKTVLNSIGIDSYPELKAQLEKINIILYGIDHTAQ